MIGLCFFCLTTGEGKGVIPIHKRIISFLGAAAIVAVFAVVLLTPTANAGRDFGMLWYNGEQLRTFGVPAETPHGGVDAIYRVPGTGGVSSVAPGDTDYHGGLWAIYDVTWNVPQYMLTSEEAVLAAEAAGDITITRNADADFRCPVLP